MACGDKSNELNTLPALLASLQLKGALVSIDAMAGHPEIARQIHEAEGDWLLALKASEKDSHTTVREHFRALSGRDQDQALPEGQLPAGTLHPPSVAPITWPAELSQQLTEEKNRGRYESRAVISVPVTDEWFPKEFLWYGLRSATCVIRQPLRQRPNSDAPTFEVHSYLSSLPADAPRLGAAIRAHWGIKNSCHHVLGVSYHEDHCQVRDQNAAHNLTILRELTTKMLRDHPGKGSLKGKRKRACLSPAFRSEIIAATFKIP